MDRGMKWAGIITRLNVITIINTRLLQRVSLTFTCIFQKNLFGDRRWSGKKQSEKNFSCEVFLMNKWIGRRSLNGGACWALKNVEIVREFSLLFGVYLIAS